MYAWSRAGPVRSLVGVQDPGVLEQCQPAASVRGYLAGPPYTAKKGHHWAPIRSARKVHVDSSELQRHDTSN